MCIRDSNKAAANFLLAKLYLNKAVYKASTPAGPYTFDKADMDKVATYVNAITADGYKLDTDYFNAFSKNGNAETIFVSLEGTPQNRWFMTLHYNQNPVSYTHLDVYKRQVLRYFSPTCSYAIYVEKLGY